MANIICRKATEEEKNISKSWETWESGDVEIFEYSYDKSCEFVCQDGKAIIHSPTHAPVEVNIGDYVAIQKGFEGKWDIISPITNKYCYS